MSAEAAAITVNSLRFRGGRLTANIMDAPAEKLPTPKNRGMLCRLGIASANARGYTENPWRALAHRAALTVAGVILPASDCVRQWRTIANLIISALPQAYWLTLVLWDKLQLGIR